MDDAVLKSGMCAPPPPAPPATAPRRLAHSTGIISLATALSRVLGFVRDLLIARLFGTGLQAEAFVVAFRLPNLLRDLVAEGPVTSAVVPVLSAVRATQPPDEFWRLAQVLACRTLAAAAAIGAAGVLAAPWLVRAIAPGFVQEPAKFALTVQLTRWLFPFITLVACWAFFCGLLNSLHRFALPALGSAVLNLLMIAGCVWLAPRMNPPVLGLVAGVLIGGVIQLAMQWPQAAREGFRWQWRWRHPEADRVSRLLGPRVIGSAVYQVNVFVNTILASLASLAGVGAVAALYFANRLVQLPVALFGVASAQASVPTLAHHAAVGDLPRFRSTLLSVLRMVMFVTLPAAAGLAALATPIVRVCFERGAFGPDATAMTARTLGWFAMGLFTDALAKVLSGAFYAVQDTRTPVRIAAGTLAVNVVLAVSLLRPMQVAGLACAASLAGGVNVWRLLRALERRLREPLIRPLSAAALRMGAAAGLMALGCAVLWSAWAAALPPVAGLSSVILSGIVVYGGACRLLGVQELSTIARWLTALIQRPRFSVPG